MTGKISFLAEDEKIRVEMTKWYIILAQDEKTQDFGAKMVQWPNAGEKGQRNGQGWQLFVKSHVERIHSSEVAFKNSMKIHYM